MVGCQRYTFLLYKLAADIQLFADLDKISRLILPFVVPMFTSLVPELINF